MQNKAMEAVSRILQLLTSLDFRDQYEQVQSRRIGGGNSTDMVNYCATDSNTHYERRLRIVNTGTLLFLRQHLQQEIPEGSHENFVYGVLSNPSTNYHTVFKNVIHPKKHNINDEMKEMIKIRVLKSHDTAEKTVVVESRDQIVAYERMINEVLNEK
jgi:hypothetical protein